MMIQEDAAVLEQRTLAGGYRLLRLRAPGIAAAAQPGQFVHLRVPRLESSVLRRPFSIFDAADGVVAIIYKEVGVGTAVMGGLRPDDALNLVGPLGRGFPLQLAADRFPVLVAGGYGMAALHLVARRLPRPGLVLVGGRSAQDILCVPDFEKLGWEVRTATEDGTAGTKGLVTRILDAWLDGERGARTPEFFACGPNGMLRVVGERAAARGWTAWLSMDRHMGCGVGACLACVVKLRRDDGSWRWARACKEGPVFECRQVQWE